MKIANNLLTEQNENPSDTSGGRETTAHSKGEESTQNNDSLISNEMAPAKSQNTFFSANGCNTNEHIVTPLLCFCKIPEESRAGLDPMYLDLVTERQTGKIRVRLDWVDTPVWRDIERCDGPTIVSAIASIMEALAWNGAIMKAYEVTNTAPQILPKSLVGEIIKFSLALDPDDWGITIDKFISERYIEDSSEISDEEIYERLY